MNCGAADPNCPRCRAAAEAVSRNGFRLSAGAWHSDDRCYAFSIESHGPATYGAAFFGRMVYADPKLEALAEVDRAKRGEK